MEGSTSWTGWRETWSLCPGSLCSSILNWMPGRQSIKGRQGQATGRGNGSSITQTLTVYCLQHNSLKVPLTNRIQRENGLGWVHIRLTDCNFTHLTTDNVFRVSSYCCTRQGLQTTWALTSTPWPWQHIHCVTSEVEYTGDVFWPWLPDCFSFSALLCPGTFWETPPPRLL